jgi:ATP:ADP antiporter, AAA family
VSKTLFARIFSSDQEAKQIALMLATGFFMGIFIATYQITADSLFLSRQGDQLNKAFLIAGALGIVTTAFYSFFQSRIRYSTLTVSAVILISVFTIGVYYLLHTRPDLEDRLIFALYCMSGPITAVLLLSFWGTFGRLFNFRQSKRIIGWIDTGQLFAAIIASFLIPISSAFVPDTTNYLLVCGVSILVVSVLLFTIASTFRMAKDDPKDDSDGAVSETETSLATILKNPYTRTMSVFLLVSMSVYILTQFSFQQAVQQQYPDERQLTNFTGFFTAAVYMLSLIMQTFVNQRIISNYGLRVSLYILPVVIGIFALGSITTGIFLGDDTGRSSFIFFFVTVALTRLFSWTFRDSLENPVYKLFFIPLDGRLRFAIQSKVEGTFNEVARFTAGLLLFGLALLPFFKIIYIMGVLLLLALAYLFIINKLYQGYRGKIHEKLESANISQQKLDRGYSMLTSRLEEFLKVPEPTKAVFSFKLLEKINAGQVPAWINMLMSNTDDAARHFAQTRLNELKGLSVSDKYVIRGDRQATESKQLLSKADLQLIIENNGEITKQRVQKLTRSFDPDDRQYAAELLLHTSKEESTSFLMELLGDADRKVRNTAIKTAVQRYNGEVINALIENLGSSTYSNQALNALLLIGEPSLVALDSGFYRSGQSTQVMLRIIQVMGRIGGTRAKEMLWQKIDYPNRVVVSQALIALGECGFKAGLSQVSRIKFAIETDVGDIRWNLSALQELEDTGIYKDIAQALRWEIQNDIEHVYMLLTMLYDTHSIQLVKENIDSGTPEGIAYAIELLDVFLSDQLKQRVIPVLDDLTDNERIGRLTDIYPRVRLDAKLVLKFLINRDFTQTNRWTKACVLYQIGLLKIHNFSLDLIAQLFNPDTLISEVAAWSLHSLSPKDYDDNVKRLGAIRKKELDYVIVQNGGKEMFFERVLFLSKIELFEKIPCIILSYLADISEEIYLKEGHVLSLDDQQNDHFYLVVSGSLKLFRGGEPLIDYTSGQFIGEMVVKEGYASFNSAKAMEDVSLMKFEKNQFYELLSDHVKLANQFLVYI